MQINEGEKHRVGVKITRNIGRDAINRVSTGGTSRDLGKIIYLPQH